MKQTLIISLLLSVIILLSLIGCSQASNNKMQTQGTLKLGDNQVTVKEVQTWQQVTVNYYDLEGGFYGLISYTGSKLLPMNLAKQYQLPGTILKVKGDNIKGMVTIQQWGQPFKITDVELVKLGKADVGKSF
tara:strand:- start:262 stop:657 length:396 start_codon:yes stop_codon:yes gene_type:complete